MFIIIIIIISSYATTLFMGQLALYRNPTSCRTFLCPLPSPNNQDPIVLLTLGISDLSAGSSRMN